MIGGRTVPLLAIFAAFTFAIMMFNVPVPGGTTAHGVGGTLDRDRSRPVGGGDLDIRGACHPGAVLRRRRHHGDRRELLQHGRGAADRRVTSCIASSPANSDMLSQRRVIAAAIGSYVGITIAALLVGVELGIQPHIAVTNGIPDYSPYGFSTAIPSMLLAHMRSARRSSRLRSRRWRSPTFRSPSPRSCCGGRRGPLTSSRRRRASIRGSRPLGFVAVAGAIMFVAGLIKGSGHIDQWAGLDWTTVNWGDAGQTVLVSAIVFVGGACRRSTSRCGA